MRIIVSHPFGNPNVYQAALAFHERQSLLEFHTCIFSKHWVHYRNCSEINGANILTHPTREIIRIAASYLPCCSFDGRRQSSVDWVAKHFDKTVARCFDRQSHVVYCYEDSALSTFNAAQRLGVWRVYDLPIGYHDEARAVAQAEVERDKSLLPFWMSLHENREKLNRKTAELRSADHIICASTYCRNSIIKHVNVESKISVIPYGCNVLWEPKKWGVKDISGPLKLIFVGRLDPRKGLHYLFEALERLAPSGFQLTMAGRWVPGYRDWLLRRRRVTFTDLGQIGGGQLLSVLRENHLLVLPSLFEGFGLVISEALACGIPVLATERTGAPDVIENGKQGFCVRAACSEDIAQVLSMIMDNRKMLINMGEEARKRALVLSWSRYRQRLAAAVIGGASGKMCEGFCE
ncbi:MAG: glycosyltransferase family 4 protein [Bryobacteraceae bacterium]